MAFDRTIVFVDLTGSTGVFEALGNVKATQAVTRLTGWIGEVCQGHDGRVVKTLGDGVLASFASPARAVDAVVEMQRDHQTRMRDWLPELRMRIKVGMARGEVVEVNHDCYGDAVNVAARLSDLSGPDQVWVTESVVAGLAEPPGVRFRDLGPINMRGKVEASAVYQIDWEDTVMTAFLTVPASLRDGHGASVSRRIELNWLNVSRSFLAAELPIRLGRQADLEFVVPDSRVSRLHARIEHRNGGFVLCDLSSFGTWVRFSGNQTEQALRRDDCVLHGRGEIALGSPLSDFSAPSLSFNLV